MKTYSNAPVLYNETTEIYVGDAVVLLAGQRTCNSQVAGSSPGRHHSVVALGKLLAPVCVCASVTK